MYWTGPIQLRQSLMWSVIKKKLKYVFLINGIFMYCEFINICWMPCGYHGFISMYTTEPQNLF